MPLPVKKLYRSKTDRQLAGVCGGLAAYFGVDSGWVRIAAALAVLFTGVGLLVYVIAAFVLPEEP
ncbi:MAG: PspC domain-containing protein [Eikenella sp.]|nr:PspC domain-containing protein [Eikenella sp.]